MKCENIIASSKKDFSVLNMVTDSWIPSCGVWVGDYPYLDRTAFRDFVKSVEETKGKKRKNNTSNAPTTSTQSMTISRGDADRNTVDRSRSTENSDSTMQTKSTQRNSEYSENQLEDIELENIEWDGSVEYLEGIKDIG